MDKGAEIPRPKLRNPGVEEHGSVSARRAALRLGVSVLGAALRFTDAEAYKAGSIQELDQIRQIDQQLHDPNITLQQRQDAEARFDGLVSELSGRFGVSRETVMDQLRKERQLQEAADRANAELVRARSQFETVVKTGAKLPESGTSGIAASTPAQTGK